MEMIKNLALNVPTETPDWMVVVMGVGVVFVGLVLIILICKIMGNIFTKSQSAQSQPVAVATPQAAAPKTEKIENRQEIIAAVTAACAEEMGTDVSALRVISFKKL